jgi:DMSO/TMAO reductase YedYZ heme-binding membrane subunit
MKRANPNLLIGSTIAFSMVIVGITFLIFGLSEESLRLSLRETARISVAIFLLVFIASSFHQLSRSRISKWLMINRRYLGISFGASHLIHLVLIVWLIYSYSSGNLLSIAPLNSYMVGGIGYIFIIAMLITSNNQSMKRLGRKRWKILHTSGMYYLFLSFIMSFVGLLEKDFSFYLPLVLALVLAACIRLLAAFSNVKKVRVA